MQEISGYTTAQPSDERGRATADVSGLTVCMLKEKARCRSSLFVTLSYQDMRLRQRRWTLISFFFCLAFVIQASLLQRNVLRTHARYTRTLVFPVRLLLLHTFLFSFDMMAGALAIRMLVSATSGKLQVIVELWYMKLSTTSSVTLSMLMSRDVGLLMPIVNKNSSHTRESLSISCWRSS